MALRIGQRRQHEPVLPRGPMGKRHFFKQGSGRCHGGPRGWSDHSQKGAHNSRADPRKMGPRPPMATYRVGLAGLNLRRIHERSE